MKLARLLTKGGLRGLATATPATPANGAPFDAPAVATVATVAVAKDQNKAANDAGGDPNRWCWPNSPAMNAGEIDTFHNRLARFTDKGVTHHDAQWLADRLVIRDREGDDRRLCLECAHLQGAVRWRCGNWKRADAAPDGLARELAVMLQRCGGFAGGQPYPSSDRR